MSDLIEVIQADVLEFRADVLALKYAQNYYGADQVVASLLINRGIVSADDIQPAPNSFRWVDTRGALPSSSVLFIGVPPLVNFSYLQIQEFTRRAILTTTRDRPDARHLVTTLHGPGIGLDEIEALHAEVRGIFSALNGHETAGSLVRISIVERNAERVKRLRAALFEAQQGAQILIGQYRTERKPRAFVAMPFSPDMEDVFYYGIQNPVRQLGYVCERVDQEAFTGDILDQVKSRIENAEVVIADLTGANPNVYLEVGYAWGKARPTVLVIKKAEQLRFDIQGQRCLQYQSIKDLETRLTNELKNLAPSKKS